MSLYGDARLVATNVTGHSGILYGFNTKVDAADSATLGHIDIQTTNPTKVVLFGCNNIKPKRAKRVKVTGESESSFVDPSAEAAAKTAGWDITTSRTSAYKDTSRTVRKKAKLSTGVFLAWKMPNETSARIAAGAAALGIVDVTDADNNVYYGVNSVMLTNGQKLGRKQLKGKVAYEQGGRTKFATTYVAYDNTP